MPKLSEKIIIQKRLSRSIALGRDDDAELLNNYIITSTALQSIKSIAKVCKLDNGNKAWSLIGSYGSGKSSLALYLSHLLSSPKSNFNKIAAKKLHHENPKFAKIINNHLQGSNGYCKVLITGFPESLIKSFLNALKTSIMNFYANLEFNDAENYRHIENLLLEDEIKLSVVMTLIVNIHHNIQKSGGKGLLIVIDELGKFLEYAARHESNDIFLLQTLAEATYKNNILLFVLLHQSFDQYGKKLNTKLKNEWTKIQGRYGDIAFVETASQSLHIMGQVFTNNIPTKQLNTIKTKIEKITKALKENNLLPTTLDLKTANKLFINCYPLHPITSLLLPNLSQKIAQNERTLFSYLGGNEPFALLDTIQKMQIGEFVLPHHIFDYFLTGQILSNDFQTQRTVVEINTALERLTDENIAQVNLLKTIGLLNIAGGIFASKTLLNLCDKLFQDNITPLLKKSIVHYRKFTNEYRIWQGSDFDLNVELEKEIIQLSALNVAAEINKNSIFLPFVAKRYSIEKHSLFYFEPCFINTSEYKNQIKKTIKPRIIFCLNDNKENEKIFKNKCVQYFSNQDICVFLNNSDEIQQASKNRIALENILIHNPIIRQDPVIQREFKLYLANAKRQEKILFDQIISKPHQNIWYQNNELQPIDTKRQIQQLLSNVLDDVYHKTPTIKNELINRDNPSAQANSGRRKLLIALLSHSDKKDLAIDLYPAEKSMYKALLQASKIHRKIDNKWQITPPEDKKYAAVWEKIEAFFNNAKEQAQTFSSLDEILTSPPFGIKKPVLPIFYMAVYLFNKDEIAVYEDRFYVPYFTPEHLERFLKRPDSFTFQQFKIEGITRSFLQEYEQSLLGGKKAPNAPKLFQAMSVFMNDMPFYTKQTENISNIAQKVRDAFKNNKSPQDLLFKKLPIACGFDNDNADGFGEILKSALQEIKNAYPKMIDSQINILAEKLNLDKNNQGQIKTKLIEYGESLQAYTIDNETTKFILTISANNNDTQHYFIKLFTLLTNKTPKEWNDLNSATTSQLLSENISLIVNLYAVHIQNKRLNLQDEVIKGNIQSLLKPSSNKILIISEIIRDLNKNEIYTLLKQNIK